MNAVMPQTTLNHNDVANRVKPIAILDQKGEELTTTFKNRLSNLWSSIGTITQKVAK